MDAHCVRIDEGWICRSDQNVAWFEVTVRDTCLMHSRDGCGCLGCHSTARPKRHSVIAQDGRKWLAFDPFENQVGLPVPGTRLI